MLQLRLHYDKKTWRNSDTKLNGLRTSAETIFGFAMSSLQALLPENLAEERGVVAQRFQSQFQVLLQQVLHLHRLVCGDIRHFQHIAFQHGQQSRADRDILFPRYMAQLHNRLNAIYMPALNHAAGRLDQIRDASDRALTAEGIAAVASRVRDMKTRLGQDLGHITQLTSAAGGPDATFTLTQAGVLPDHKRFEELAIRDISRLRADGVLVKLARKYMTVVSAHKDVRPAPADALGRADRRRADRDARASGLWTNFDATMAAMEAELPPRQTMDPGDAFNAGDFPVPALGDPDPLDLSFV